jgi:hypothetical protein
MKSKVWLCLLAVIVVAGFTGTVQAGKMGGPECPTCNAPVPATKGPWLHGSFTVALDGGMCSSFDPWTCGHYNIQAVLKRGSTMQLYSFPAPLLSMDGTDENGNWTYNLCDVSASDFMVWQDCADLGAMPCMLGVAKDFGFDGYTPVITHVEIKKKDFCGTGQVMLKGHLRIRLVPPPKTQ